MENSPSSPSSPSSLSIGQPGLPADQIAFVSSNSWDALAATWYGYQTLWVNRNQLPFEEFGTQPTYTGSNLRNVLGLPFAGAAS